MNVLLMLNERKIEIEKEAKKHEEMMKRFKQIIDDACKAFVDYTDDIILDNLNNSVPDMSNMFLNCSHLSELPDFYTID